MSDVINGYELAEPLTNANAGFAKWGRAQKGGRDYFIKEFLNPCYPAKDSPYDDATKANIKQSCERFELQRTLLYSQINKTSDGNLQRIEEFFRWDGKYYVATRWLDQVSKQRYARVVPAWGASNDLLSIKDIASFDEMTRVKLCLSLSHAMMKLHNVRIVHADLKPGNILFVQTQAAGISAKIIDMDSSFFEGETPDELVGDQVYFAPESIMYMIKGPSAANVSCSIDVFALGLLFHQALVGKLPDMPPGYSYAFEACLDGYVLEVDKRIPNRVGSIIASMLERDAVARPNMREVYGSLWRCLYGGAKTEPKAPDPTVVEQPAYGTYGYTGVSNPGETGRLRGTGLRGASAPGANNQSGQGSGMDSAFFRPKGF